MIEIRNLRKVFNERPVLRGINLDIFDNETIVILGPSGQGKTIFIKIPRDHAPKGFYCDY